MVLSKGLVPCNNNNNKRACAGQLNGFTHLRSQTVLHDRGTIIIPSVIPREPDPLRCA
jgi:hypothetical protein